MAGRRAGAGLALAALALSAAGCGFGGSTTTVTVVHRHTVTVTITRTVTMATTSAATSACTGDQLSGNFQAVGGSGAAGQISYDLRLTNTSQTSCYVIGLPRVQLLNANKSRLPTHVVAAGSGSGEQVVLAAGNTAHAQARFSPSVPGSGDSQSGRCQPEAWYLRVSPGGGGTVDVQIAPPTSVCERGTLNFDVYSAAS
jgi:hypothetical protein